LIVPAKLLTYVIFGGEMPSLLLTNSQTIIVLLVLALLLFGAKRLPDSARSLGRSMRIFKSEIKALESDEKKNEEEDKQS
jgi:sec-independent protein translocase protein TatA